MDKQTVQIIMKFMLKANLLGHEVPAFNASMNALQAELDRKDAEQTLQETADLARAEYDKEIS